MQIQEFKVDNIKPYANNPRHNDDAVKAVATSIQQFGFKVPIVVDQNGVIVTGHTRLKAAKRLGLDAVPVIVADDLTDEQIRAFRIADNKVSEAAEWDEAKLAEELQAIEDAFTGFDDREFERLMNAIAPELIEDEYDTAPSAEPVSRFCQRWQLGNHILMCGDSTKEEDVRRLTGGALVDLVCTDPPYGMGKEKDGVIGDNQNADDLLDFNKEWIPLSLEALKQTGSWYCWNLERPIMDIVQHIMKPLEQLGEVSYRNLIIWDKGTGYGLRSKLLRGYTRATEYCLFYHKAPPGLGLNADSFPTTMEPLYQYMREQANKVGLTAKLCKEITGTVMYKHWFTRSQFELPTKKYYSLLQEAFKGQAFERDYDMLAQARDDMLAYFDNTHEVMTDVWSYSVNSFRDQRDESGGHATPKPLELIGRIIKSSSRIGESVLDLFGGSGTTLIACEQLNRKCYMMEYDPKYCDVIIGRWEKLTGEKAVLLDD